MKKADVVIAVFKYGFGVGLLAWVVSANWEQKPDGAPGLKQLLAGPIAYDALAAAAALMAVTISLQFVRWFLLVRALDLPFTLWNAFRLGLCGYFFSMFLPSSIGGDAVKAVVVAQGQPGRRAAAVATVIIDRAMGLFGLLLFAAVSGSVAWALGDPRVANNPKLQDIVYLSAGLAGGMTAGYLLLGVFSASAADKITDKLKGVPKVGHSAAEAWYAVWMYRQRMRTVVLGVGLTAVCHFCMVSSFYFASRTFGAIGADAQASYPEVMVIAPMAFIIQALPLSPGGVGVGELAFSKLYELCGRDPSAGTASRLALRVVEWALGVIGYVVYLRSRADLPVTADAADLDVVPPHVADETGDSKPGP